MAITMELGATVAVAVGVGVGVGIGVWRIGFSFEALVLFIGRFSGLRFNGHFGHFTKWVLILMFEYAKVDNHCMLGNCI